jgi:LytS/YehU family sensor histidine kinase
MKMKLNKTTILVITTAALFIQLLIITYNHYTGYINISGTGNFLLRLFIGTTISALFGLLIVFIDLKIISFFDKMFPPPQKLYFRIPIEIFVSLISGAMIGAVLTISANTIFPYEDGLIKNIINNLLIVSVINLIAMAIIEAVIWFKRNEENKLIAEKLENENMQIKFQTLKDQLNPHFLFNSLNVLSSLTSKDPEKAQKFVDEFSMIYRYTLDVIDKPVVELKDEIEFVKSFLYLQKIRFDDAVEYEINIDAQKLTYLVPPLALQTLLENSFKHNKASSDFPLMIKIFNDADFIVIVNNLQPKTGIGYSTKVGLENLRKRYDLICGIQPSFTITENEYIAKIPLINPEQ